MSTGTIAHRKGSLTSLDTEQAITQCRNWIEECTGQKYTEPDFRVLLQDGVVLCELIQCIKPDLIKKINRGKTPFAHRENIGFFLSACHKLGLKGGQLFDLTDLQEVPSTKNGGGGYQSRIGRLEQERKLRNVAVTLYWLNRTVCRSQEYSGPQLNLSAFGSIVSSESERKRPSSVTAINVSSHRISSGSLSSPYSAGLPRYNSVELLLSPTGSDSGRLSEFGFSSIYSSRESLNLSQQDTPVPATNTPEERKNSQDLARPVFSPQITVQVKSPVRSKSFDSLPSDPPESPSFSPTHSDKEGDLLSSTEVPTSGLQVITEEEEKGSSENQVVLQEGQKEKTDQEETASVKQTEEVSPVQPATVGSPTKSAYQGVPVTEEQASTSQSLALEVQAQISKKEEHFREEKSQEKVVEKSATSEGERTTKPEPAIQEDPLKEEIIKSSPTAVETPSEEYKKELPQLPEARKVDSITFDSSKSDIPCSKNSGQSPGAVDKPVDTEKSTVSFQAQSENQTTSQVLTDLEDNSEKMSRRRLSVTPSSNVSKRNSSVSKSDQVQVTPTQTESFVIHPKEDGSPSVQSDIKVTLRLEKGKMLGFQLSEATDKSGNYRLISDVTPGSPAALAGMHKLDYLTSVNGQSIFKLAYKQVVQILKDASKEKPLELGLCRFDDQPEGNLPPQQEVTQPPQLQPTQPPRQDASDSQVSPSLGPDIAIVTNTSVKPLNTGSQLSVLRGSFVRVESDAVPIPQHAKKVVYPPKSSNEVSEPEITSPLSDSSMRVKIVSTESLTSSENEQLRSAELQQDQRRKQSESFSDSVLKEAVERVRTMSENSPLPSPTPELPDDTKSIDTLLSDHSSVQSRDVNERKMKERERRRQKIDEGAKAYQKYQMNGRRPGSTKTTSVTSPIQSAFKMDPKSPGEDRDKGGNVGETSSPPPKPPRKENAVTDILRRLSISLRPLPAFEDEGHTGAKDDYVKDGPLEGPLALNIGSDTESGHLIRTEDGSVDKESTASQQSGRKQRLGYGARIDALLQAIRTIHDKVGNEEDGEDLQALERVIRSPEMKKAIEMDEMMRCIVQGTGPVPTPVDKHAVPASVMFRSALKKHPDPYSEVEELRELMRNPFIQGLFFCHDKVATRDFYVPESTPSYIDAAHPDLVAIPSDSLDQLSRDHLYRKDQSKTITITRSDKPLGLVVQRDDSLNGIFIWQLLHDYDAFTSGMFHEGDELLEVNGISVSGMSAPQAMKILNGLAGTHMTFSIIPSENPSLNVAALEQCYLRAHVDYDPLMDSEHPCRELGLEFRRGDILKVLNQDDSNWWQARVVDELGDGMPGLIPAKHMQEKRLALRHTYHGDMEVNKPKKRGIKSLLPIKKKKRKTYYYQDQFQDGSEDVIVYEDVVKLSPNPQRKRPIAIIGAPGVGRKTLIKRLIDSNPEQYATCIPHTSRPMRLGEINGKDYYFATREQMEKEIRNKHFLEYGEHKGNLYGVSIETVMNLMKLGRVPVLDLHPQSLKLLRSAAMMPYTIFIKAPPMDRMLSTRQVMSNRKGRRDEKVFLESELEEIYRLSINMEAQYSHYFDWIIVNDDLQVASDFLIEMARRIETDVQWVPAIWCEDRPV